MKWLQRLIFCIFIFFGTQIYSQGSLTSIDSTGFSVPEMIFVAGGSFDMGSNLGAVDEKPVHQVTLDDFYIGKYEVTQKQWRELMGIGTTENYFPGCDSCPVERVTWYNVNEYIKRLNNKTGMNFRLPTEAEWEFAARGGRFSKGFKFSGSDNLDSIAWRDGNSNVRTHPVGQKKPNELGIYDMCGNVWEWCSDFYSADYYQKSPVKNPRGPEEGSYRVIRGGSWFHDSKGLRVNSRDSGNPVYYYGYIGFRLCRSAEGKK